MEKQSMTGSSFSHSQQTYLVPSALLIGNESTEREPLIANESWVIHCVCGSACLFGWTRGFWGCLWPKTEHTCIIHLAETGRMCECELLSCVWSQAILDLDFSMISLLSCVLKWSSCEWKCGAMSWDKAVLTQISKARTPESTESLLT